MNRRQALRNSTRILGGLLAVPGLGILTGFGAHDTHDHHHVQAAPSKPASTTPFVPQTLTAAQNERLIAITERIIPASDTPGAKEAKVNEYIDRILSLWMKEDEKGQFLAGLEGIEQIALHQFGRPITKLLPTEQDKLLRRYAQAAKSGLGANGQFFKTLKSLTLEGYYTSEIGATQELQYSAAHGAYIPDAPLSQIGRAWA
ncbi:MAG: gluconate 2-dehydrogenase subunit 3 family protein [Bacteroidetes Order II. Incertae sedis bacterium]|nr:gluconate 2-dehydrogenase subunit 3 family protein [Bacteroidetes Order II. bacterium]